MSQLSEQPRDLVPTKSFLNKNIATLRLCQNLAAEKASLSFGAQIRLISQVLPPVSPHNPHLLPHLVTHGKGPVLRLRNAPVLVTITRATRATTSSDGATGPSSCTMQSDGRAMTGFLLQLQLHVLQRGIRLLQCHLRLLQCHVKVVQCDAKLLQSPLEVLQ